MAKCPVCDSTKVVVDPVKQPIRCNACGWVITKTKFVRS
jgi:transcription initiation factor TFIIIB Brf1 subunit/transcription initiation factor TFIIB